MRTFEILNLIVYLEDIQLNSRLTACIYIFKKIALGSFQMTYLSPHRHTNTDAHTSLLSVSEGREKTDRLIRM